MNNVASSDCVLHDILKVLQRIEERLNGHESRFQSLEEHANKVVGTGSIEREEDTESYTLSPAEVSNVELSSWRPSPKGTPTYEYSDKEHNHARIPYRQWSIDHSDRLLNFTISTYLKTKLGGCGQMPDDNRLPLKFFLSHVFQMMAQWGPSLDTFPVVRQSVEKDLLSMCQFDEDHRAHPGNDFIVVDFDPFDNTRLYRLGGEAIGPELEVESHARKEAPWSRLVLYQGATTGKSTFTAEGMPQKAIPYFSSTDKIVGLWDHLDYHLQTKRRGTTVNPYSHAWNGFHTNFYEVREVTEWSTSERWKHGPLYGHPLGWHFRKCAYTIYTPVSTEVLSSVRPDFSRINRHWTLLILAPHYFFDDKNTSFPMAPSSLGRAKALGYTLGKLTEPGAEMHLIGQGLEKITQRWADFLSYFDYILDGGDSLMKPAEHDNLLFDDGSFSRSRKYFWAIDCLSEFDLSITDNIAQWELYKAARVPPVRDLPDLDRRQLLFAERQYRILQNQRESFRQKLASTKALRDALFNASAVIESRASTRLGENVKLLTFVSIFFLPLAFTTSLWSVNDQFSMKALIYVVIIVALLTYLTMFNINSLAEGFGRIYDIKKKHVVRAMKCDQTESWKLRGQRFEVFRPKHETPEPSEWYIPLYALTHPLALLGLRYNHTTGARAFKIPFQTNSNSFTSLFSRRKQKAKEPEEPDQPWVIE